MTFEYRSKEQTSFAKLISQSISPGLPLLAGAAAGVGKTHGYSIPLLEAASHGAKIAISFPTWALIEQYELSDGLAAARRLYPNVTIASLHPRRHFQSKEESTAGRDKAHQADILLLTHQAALIDARMAGYAALRLRDVVLFDEADQLADAADLRSTFSLPANGSKDIGEILRKASLVDDLEIRAAASAIRYAIDHPGWYKVVGFDSEGDLMLKHKVPGRMLKPLIRDAKRCIFVSGTLQVSKSFKAFMSAVGLRDIDPASRHIDPEYHGELEAHVTDGEMTMEDQAGIIMQSTRPTLVLTTSFADTIALGSLVPGAIIRQRGEKLAHAIMRCSNNAVLITPGAWTGLDNPDRRWGTIIVPKAPYGQPAVIDGQYVTHYSDSASSAQRRINQGLHRGLRTQDARCKLLLLDPRCSRPELAAGIPERFALDRLSV